MANTPYDIIHNVYALEASASVVGAKRLAFAQDTRRLVFNDSSTFRYFWDSTRLADQTGVYGASIIGAQGITGVTPTGGGSGSGSDLQSMIEGIAALALGGSGSFIANGTGLQSSANFHIDGNGTINGLLKLNQAADASTISFQNVANNVIVNGSNASGLVFSTTNNDNTNASTTNNIHLNYFLTQDLANGGSVFSALKIDIEKVSDWTNPNLLASNITFTNRWTDLITSMERPFLSASGVTTTIGDPSMDAFITITDESINLNAGNSTDGVFINSGGVNVASFINDFGITFENALAIYGNCQFFQNENFFSFKTTTALGNSISQFTPIAIDTTAAGTLAVVNSGIYAGAIKSTSAAVVNIQLDTATNILAYFNNILAPFSTIVGAYCNIEFVVDNVLGANDVNILLDASISVATPAITGGDNLVVTQPNNYARFNLYFYSATNAILSRII